MARTSHVRIRKLIEEEIRSMPDQTFFLSRAYAAYLTDIAEIMTKRYGIKKCAVNIIAGGDKTAYTDNLRIVINYYSEMISCKTTRKGKHEMIKGLLLHEVSHMLYTNFELVDQICSDLEKIGSLELLPEEEELETEFVTYFSKYRGTNLLQLLRAQYHYFVNALEDAHVNRRVCKRFPGFATTLEMVVDKIIMDAPSFSEMLAEETSKIGTITSMIHLYAISSELLYEEWESLDERVQMLYELLDLIDESVYTYKSSDRLRIQNTIFAKLLPFLMEQYDGLKAEKIPEDIDKMIASYGESTGKGTSAPSAIAEEESSEIGETYKAMREGKAEGRVIPERTELEEEPDESEETEDAIGESDESEEEAIEDTPSDKELRDELRRRVCEESPFKSSHKDPESKRLEDEVNEKAAKEIEKILDEICDEKVESAKESEFEDELNDFAAAIQHSAVHDGVPCKVRRIREVDPRLIEMYETIAPEATRYGRQTAKHFEKLVMKRKKGFKMDGLYSGRHFEAHAFSRGDGKYFSRKIAPSNHPNLAVMVLVDESGSTGGKRIAYERLAALVIHDFCTRLNIPVSVYGHYETFGEGKVILTSYADFDKPDPKDKYRIMGIDAHDNNRDGYALKFCAEKLMKQGADFKLLISISDGEPAASGYSGMIGCEDVAGVIKECKRKGITPIAAAIGEDKEAIEHIYRENFLNISDLETLPKRLTDLVKRYVK